MSYWWCLDHKTVEQGLGCGSTTRLGPYDTQQQAAKDKEIEKKWGPKKGWF